MFKVFTALLLATTPVCAAEVPVLCHVTDEERFMTDANGHVLSYTQRNPLTTETFTIVDSGIKGFPQGEATPDHANGINDANGVKQSVFISRTTGSLMEVLEFAPIDGTSGRWVRNGTCQKSEAF